MKIKIFTSCISGDDLENKIAKWNKKFNPTIINVKTTAVSLQDYYDTGRMCNNWIEYITTIIYE